MKPQPSSFFAIFASMVPSINKKKNVVKHRTRSEYQPHSSTNSDANLKGKGKSGFKVGPSHAPDGSYLGKMKKRKAELIEKAKIKKKYFKGSGQNPTSSNDPIQYDSLFSERDEGRFAPEQGGVQDGLGLLEIDRAARRKRKEEEGGRPISQRAQVKANQSKAAEMESKRRLQGGFMHSNQNENEESKFNKNSSKLSQTETAEQRKEQRQKRQEKWNEQSGSKTGRQRGQPNLGARMDLLLDKIKQK